MKRALVILYSLSASGLILMGFVLNDYSFYYAALFCVVIAILIEKTHILTIRIIALTLFTTTFIFVSYQSIISSSWYSNYQMKKYVESLSLEETLDLICDGLKRDCWTGYLYNRNTKQTFMNIGRSTSLDACRSESRKSILESKDAYLTEYFCGLNCKDDICERTSK